jgi:heme/copper-type cytochrome/quinol oxidase subunit 1
VLAVAEEESTMLSARLFAALAMLQFGLAMFESKTAHQSIDVYFHATYFVVAKTHLQILQALASACFALIYLAAARWVLHPLNNSLGSYTLLWRRLGRFCSRFPYRHSYLWRQHLGCQRFHRQIIGRFSRVSLEYCVSYRVAPCSP